jgi:chlorite dismutase
MQVIDFTGTDKGEWKVLGIVAVAGKALAPCSHLDLSVGTLSSAVDGVWSIKGTRSNMRYTHKTESETLTAVQASLGRAEATHAALIPIKKSEAWWAMAQDERRKIFEEQSKHIGIGLKYLPAIARRLYHCRDLGQEFDFLTWFEYAPQHATHFEELVQALRETTEWKYVEREVDIRLVRT